MSRYLGLWWGMLRLSLRRQTGLTLATLATIAGSTLTLAVSALAMRFAVDAMANGNRSAAVLGGVSAAAIFAVNLALQDVSLLLRNTVTDRISRLEVHPAIHRDIAGLAGLEHLERTDVLNRVTVVGAGYEELVASAWNAILVLAQGLQLAVMLVLLAAVSPWLLLLLPVALVPVWCEYRGQRGVRQAEVDTAEAYRVERHLADLAVAASSGKEIRVTGSGAELVRRQAAVWQAAMSHRLRAQIQAASWWLAGWLVFAAAFLAGLALVTRTAAAGHATLGDLVLAVTVAARLRQSVQGTVQRTTAAAGAGRLIQPYLWLRDYVSARRATAAAASQPAPSALRHGIVLSGLHYTYPGTNRPALADVSVALPAGAVVAVVGAYGSGKTTLVKLLCKFYQPDAGRILVDGTDLADIATDAWRDRLSAAFQDFGRFRTVVGEAVGLGDLPHLTDHQHIARAVDAADARDVVAALPAGLRTQLGRELGGVDLSEGQWQRLALARASMRNEPLLFVLDEPTASLDAPSEKAIFDRYLARARLLGQRTGAVTVIVSHRFSTVTGADLILVLDSGRLIEAGDHDTLVRLGGQYAELYDIHARAYATAP
jgi:ABC-type multidrug transport system fused ATPase/permease subunit